MKSPRRQPKYTLITKASDFCKDIIFTNLVCKQNTAISNIMETEIEEIIESLSNKKIDFKNNQESSSKAIRDNLKGKKEPDFFPFSRITVKKKDPIETSSNFFSQSNKYMRSNEDLIEKAKSTEIEKKEKFSDQLHLKREPFSFKPEERLSQAQKQMFAISETNKIFDNREKEEISLVPQTRSHTNSRNTKEYEQLNKKFQHQTATQELLADQYYVERNKRKVQAIKYGYITNKIRNDSLEGQNNSFIYDKLEYEVQKNLMNPVEIDIKSKNRILGNQLKTKEGLKLIKVKNDPQKSYRNAKSIQNPFDPIEVATKHPEFHKNTLLLASPKSLEKVRERTQKKVEVKKVNLEGFNDRYNKSSIRRSYNQTKNGLGQSAIKQILKQEAGRIKREIETIKSNLESYRTGPINNMMQSDPVEKKPKSEKFNNLHSLIKNSLYN